MRFHRIGTEKRKLAFAYTPCWLQDIGCWAWLERLEKIVEYKPGHIDVSFYSKEHYINDFLKGGNNEN